jgi:hypothetical protein
MMVMTAKRAARTKAEGGRGEFHRKSMAALQDAKVPFLIGGAYWLRRMLASRDDRKISIYTFDPVMSMQPSMRSPAPDTKRKKRFRIGWPKRGVARTIST